MEFILDDEDGAAIADVNGNPMLPIPRLGDIVRVGGASYTVAGRAFIYEFAYRIPGTAQTYLHNYQALLIVGRKSDIELGSPFLIRHIFCMAYLHPPYMPGHFLSCRRIDTFYCDECLIRCSANDLALSRIL